jgi:FkbM family methyltransferase
MDRHDLREIIATKNTFISDTMPALKKRDIVFAYGFGAAYLSGYPLLQKANVKVDYIIDSDPARYGTTFEGTPIMHPDALTDVDKGSNYAVLITAPSHYNEILASLITQGVHIDNIFECPINLLEMNTPETFRDLLNDNTERVLRVYSSFADNYSREVFENVLRARATYQLKYFRAITSPDMYFPADIIHLNTQEVLLDLGAYTGDTLLDFVQRTNGQYKGIVCFEPEPKNYVLLQEASETLHDVHLFQLGAYSKTTKLALGGSGIGAKIVEGKGTTQCARIDDNVFQQLFDTIGGPTYIKMDIEGAEIAALFGMQETIKRYKPKLAISVYHKDSDLIEVPEIIQSLEIGYRLYLRQHYPSGSDTVLYAVYNND